MLLRKHGWVPWVLSGLLAVALVLGFSTGSRADKLEEYSAEQVSIENGKEQKAGNIYFSGDKIRMERIMPGKGGNAVIIFRQDRKLSWTVFPEKKKYLETELNEKDMENQFGLPLMGAKDFSMKEEDLGQETILGYKCRKKRIESTMEMMGRKITGHSTVWTSDKIDLPIRTEDSRGHVMELRNIREGKQNPALFEIPAGFSRAANILEAMGDMEDQDEAEPGVRRRGPAGMPPQGQMPPEMPEELRKLLEKQMGKQPK